MASRNYYVVLGVASTESGEGIRSAYRDLAKQLHPDHIGPAGSANFRELTEAYDVLRDPLRRRQYDEALQAQRGERRISMRGDLAEVRPSEEAISGRFARNFSGVAFQGASASRTWMLKSRSRSRRPTGGRAYAWVCPSSGGAMCVAGVDAMTAAGRGSRKASGLS